MAAELFSMQELMMTKDEKEISKILSGFKCSRNRDSERFLKNASLIHEKRSISRTYLMMDGGKISGFFTLALKCLGLNEADLKQDLVESMNLKDGIAQSYLLGQVAKSDNAEQGLGRDMINLAFGLFSRGKEMFGCRMVRLDCRDELINYYRSCGFQQIRRNTDLNLNQMAAFI